ncbi:MAG: TolC family protein [Candidatus Cryptobacteroides sp.]
METAKDAGVAMSNDLIKVELKRNELISSRIQLDNAIKLTSKAICQMTGLNYSDSIKFEDSLDPYGIVEEEDPALELKLLDYGIREAKLRKKMEIGKSLPQLGLGVNASFNNILYGNSFNTGIFLSLKIPLSDWWGTSHKIKECNYSVRQAELQRKDLGEKLELQHFQSAGKINECLQILTQKEMAVDLAEENYRLSLLGYEAGTVSISDLLEARSILLQAESEYTDACIQCLIQRKRYAKGL